MITRQRSPTTQPQTRQYGTRRRNQVLEQRSRHRGPGDKPEQSLPQPPNLRRPPRVSCAHSKAGPTDLATFGFDPAADRDCVGVAASRSSGEYRTG